LIWARFSFVPWKRIKAVNWYGANYTTLVPGGLSKRPYMEILRTIKYLGFNAIRIPYSNYLIEHNPVVVQNLDANPQFRGKHALDIMDAIFNGARQVGLMVILDDHYQDPKTISFPSTLWYTPHFTQQQWINDWLLLARRYRTNPAVVGFDLYNEPHSNGPGLEILGLGYLKQGATWGPFQGVSNPVSDWRLAAEQAGNAILGVNPHLLIIVEGTEIYPYKNPLSGPTCPDGTPATGAYCADVYWWAGNLEGVKNYPVILNEPHHVVYSPHEYGPGLHGQRWIKPHMTEQDWQQAMYKHWGYLLDATGPNAAPVWVGEFGTFSHVNRGAAQSGWFKAMLDYLQAHPRLGFAYWALNGAQSDASYGLLDPDWSHLARPSLIRALRAIS
jgi:endoglucanase